ncbi:hypothetical protein C461_03657 [Halorubrum aidingense JCM 13560]|uniref:Uncharacterized protein n=1 Tax=Halorubrum aidingense JCM 13560 TaxID=1230454 RepID=M0PEY7_9EURY|nr:hypothetical protein [Halorubrum aidingense]EMA68692.1 hypothetical protein C461_03657 [Halorubrum aidingense JCM 13560]
MTAQDDPAEEATADDTEESPADELGESPVEERDGGSHLDEIQDGAGCTEIWEHLSENRDD